MTTADLSSLRRGSLVEEVIDLLKSRITNGEWPVGERIPPESELVGRLGVGRGTVREAVCALSHAGLLEVRQGDGTYVRTRSELSGALRRQIARSTDGHVQEVRRAVEVEAARLAAARRTDEDLAACAAALAEREAATRAMESRGGWDEAGIDAWLRADVRFHQAVVAAAHNPMLHEMYLELTDALGAVLRRLFAEPDHDPHLVRGHAHLLDALIARDAERAVVEAMHNVEADLD